MKTRITFVICLCLFFTGRASAQWVVNDPGNLVQGIINASKNIAHTSKTATNMVNSFQGTVKIHEQDKKYYDALKSVNNLAKNARKVWQTILMVGDITDIHVTSFQKMPRDDNFAVEELGAIAFGYTKLLEESNDVLTELKSVVNITMFSMTDKERMDVMERCHSRMKRYRNPVSYYTNENISVSYLRAKKKNDLDCIMGLYGSTSERYWQSMESDSLHQILRSLYGQMTSLCADVAGVTRGAAGLGALFYITYRVQQSLARAEPIGVFPMLRPFAVSLYIVFFPPMVLGMMSSVLLPAVQGTTKLLKTQTLDMNKYREQRDRLEYEAVMRNPETAYLVSNEEFDEQLKESGRSPSNTVTMAGIYINQGMYKMKEGIRDFFREISELMFQAFALVMDTIHTFFLMVLAILGPMALAISVWDGFQSTLTQWICRYIQVHLWLPVSDIFSTIFAKIQVLMLQSDIGRMQADPNFSLDPSDGAYIVFMVIGIIGYSTIPTVTGWIIQAEGMGGYGRNVDQMAGRAGGMAGSVAGATASSMVGRAGKLLK